MARKYNFKKLTEEQWFSCPDSRVLWNFLLQKGMSQHWAGYFAFWCRTLFGFTLHEHEFDWGVVIDEDMEGKTIEKLWVQPTNPYRDLGTGEVDGEEPLTMVDALWAADIARCFVGSPFHNVVLGGAVGPYTTRRGILQNPYTKSILFDPSWLEWEDRTILRLLHRAQDDVSVMPILADALEDAGCQEELIVNHLREGTHDLENCWVLRTMGEMLT